jgi:hypothetical protein
MLSRRPATLFRLLAMALVIPGCGAGQPPAAPSPVSVPAPTTSVGLTCALGTTDCSSVMQWQTLTFTASPGAGTTGTRSATLTFGDGTPPLDLGPLASPAAVSHEYASLGTFTARLEVRAGSEMRSASLTIKVDTIVTASIGATNLGDLNVEATADVQGAAVDRYEWLFEPGSPAVVTFQPRVLFAYSSPGYKAVELKAALADGRVIRASAHVIVGREHEP